MNAVVAPATTTQLPVSADENAFALAQRKAMALANSTLVPPTYRGRDNLPNVLIALEISQRIGASPLLVMQNLHVIQGKPSWSSTFLIATVNACGRFTPMRFEAVGDDPTKDDYKVRAFAEDKATGEKCVGPWVTWAMVKAEGWLTKSGSKWKTMPELMFLYRAAGFWSRLYAPEVSMGILTREEVEDVWGSAPTPTAPTEHGNLRTLEAQLTGQPIDSTATEVDPDAPTAQDVHDDISNAKNRTELEDAFDLIRSLPEAERPALIALYETRRDGFDLDEH